MRYRFRSRKLALLLGGLLIGVILASLLTSLYVARQQEIHAWRNQLSNLSLILAEQTRQEVTSAYLILDSITQQVQIEGVTSAAELRTRMGTQAVYQSMRDKIRGLPVIDVATVVAANGDVINFTRAFPAPAINLADRDYFAAQLANPKLDVFISKPVRNKGNGAWTFYLSRRLNGPHGEFLGLCLVGLSSSFLSDFYRKITLGPGSSVTLYRADFVQLARWPHADALMGAVNRQGSTYQIIGRAGLNDGVVITSSPRLAQGGAPVERMGAARRVEGYPLLVNVTVVDDVFLQRWRDTVWQGCTLATLSALAVGIAFALLLRSLKRREDTMALTERLRREAESASRAKSEFLAMMSHEIRTPLTAIIGFAELLGGKASPAAREEGAQIIVRNGQHLLHVINEILDISKIEAGRLHLEQAPFAPLDVVAGLDTMMSAQAASKGIRFAVTVDYPFPSQVLGDATRWKQILFNLCSNAVKFTELGSVTLVLAYHADSERLACTVVDTGIGIADADRARLFAPFQQADRTVARKYGGTGLGLHLVKRLAERMGGAVRVASVPGQGSVFDVEIAAPLAPEATWLTEGGPAAAAVQEPARAVPPRLHGKVLLAEDGPDNRTLIGARLAQFGLDYDVAENGVQAVERALAGDYDVVLMDIQMPEMDGLRATEVLRAAGYAGPIVALTANVMADDVQRYLRGGCTRCLGKPVDFAELAAVLGELLGLPAPDTNGLDDLPEMVELRALFAVSLHARLARMRAACADADWATLGNEAHMLKGSAASFSHAAAGDLAAAIERAVRSADHAGAREAMAELCELYSSTDVTAS